MALQLLNLGASPNTGTGDPGRSGGQKINDNFTELYTFCPGPALMADGSVDSSGGQLFQGNLAVGNTATLSDLYNINLDATITPSAPGQFPSGLLADLTVDGGLIATQPAGITLNQTMDGIGAFGTVSGIQALNVVTSNQTANLSGITVFSSIIQTQAGSGAPGNVYHFAANAGVWNGPGPLNHFGLNCANMGASGASSAAGINIVNQSGATINHGIRLFGDGVGSDIVFGQGRDANIYYDGDDMIIDSDYQVTGAGLIRFNAASNWTANGVGTVTISNVAPAGIGTATISKWLTVKDNAGVTYYIPAWT